MQTIFTFDEIKNKFRRFGAVVVSKRKNSVWHQLAVKALAIKYFRTRHMMKRTHIIFRMRDGPPSDTGPPDTRTSNKDPNQTGPPQTGSPMEWLVLKQTRVRY